MTGPGPIGNVLAVCNAARPFEDEFALDEGAAALAPGVPTAAGGGAAFAEPVLLAGPAPEPGDPFVLNGAQATFDLLLAWMTTLLPPKKAGASRIVER